MNSNSLPLSLQASLAASFNSSLGLNVTMATPPKNKDSMSAIVQNSQVHLSETLKTNLADSFASAYAKDWSIPSVARALTQEEIRFLQTHTVEELKAPPANAPYSPVLQFFVQVLQATLTQSLTESLQDLRREITPKSRSEELAEIKENSEENHTARKPASTGDIIYDYEDTVLPEYASEDKSGGKNPEKSMIKKISVADVQRRVQSMGKEVLKESITKVGENVPLERAYQTLSEGHSIPDAAKVAVDAANAEKAFIKYAGKVISTGAAAGTFFSKVEEIGWEGAIGETTKTITIGFVAKHSANIVTNLVGCTNPIWCAKVVTTIIADVFVPTETAPSRLDMRQAPSSLPSFEDLRGTGIPHLDPPYPVLRNPRYDYRDFH